jgi:hypothetical protein
MFAANQNQSDKGAGHERGFVSCEKCNSPIAVQHPNNVSIEFSVPCTKCGHRGIYFKRMLMAENPANRRG